LILLIKQLAEKNTLRYVYEYPQRGIIYDANGKILAGWRPIYNLAIIPYELEPFDTNYIAQLLATDTKLLKTKIEKNKKWGDISL